MPRTRTYSIHILNLFFLAMAGCWLNQGDTVKPPPAVQQDTTLGPGDIFDVRVFNEESLSSKYQVASDGTIDYPLIGNFKVEGLSPQIVATLISDRLVEGKFLKNPQVSVLVLEYKSKQIHILGQVARPGTFPFQQNMSVLQAVTLAGGFTPIASKNKTTITRLIEGKEIIIRAEVDKISKGEKPNISLQAGDIIHVPERVF
ncbi:MAG: polysaccharide biosynthesis/export family protein [Pseudomonadota bacterium]